MTRQAYYEVPKDAYLFQDVVASRPQPLEEPIRQWCAHELLRAYGISITSLNFERQVKIGSTTYFIDICVLREGLPLIVVECKAPGFSLHEKACAQGESYASVIRAPYMLYTNGDKWLVRHKVNDAWITLDDLPRWGDRETDHNLLYILDSVDRLKPILHKLDEPVAGLDAKCLLEHLQSFFVNANPLMWSIDHNAIHGSDHLLRTLLDKDRRDHHIEYCIRKLDLAYHDWDKFRANREIGRKLEPPDHEGKLGIYFSQFQYDLADLLPHLARPFTIDALVLRLNIALLDYAVKNETDPAEFAPLTPTVHQALRDLINSVLAERFQSRLPDIIERDLDAHMKGYCEDAWKTLRRCYDK